MALAAAVRTSSEEVQQLLRAIAGQELFRSGFDRGPRGGAMIQLAVGVRIECFLPYVEEKTGLLLPFVPMELTGEKIHDYAQSEPSLCRAGDCSCEAPVGWRLTRPLLRGLLGVTDATLNEHSRELPGRLPGWRLAVATLPFMEAYFDPDFAFSTRDSARAARREYAALRRRRPRKSASRTKWRSRA